METWRLSRNPEEWLSTAGITGNVADIIGRKFYFKAEIFKEEIHLHIWGTVIGITISDDGLFLYMSVPRIGIGTDCSNGHLTYLIPGSTRVNNSFSNKDNILTDEGGWAIMTSLSTYTIGELHIF